MPSLNAFLSKFWFCRFTHQLHAIFRHFIQSFLMWFLCSLLHAIFVTLYSHFWCGFCAHFLCLLYIHFAVTPLTGWVFYLNSYFFRWRLSKARAKDGWGWGWYWILTGQALIAVGVYMYSLYILHLTETF